MRLRIAVLVCLFGLSAASARGQQYVGALKIGGAVSSLTGSSMSDFEPRTGLAGGVAFGYDFGNGLAVIPEAIYVVKGAYADGFQPAIVNGELIEIPIRARFDLTYLEVPVLVSYRFFRRSRIEPRIFAGPSVAFKLGAQIRFRRTDGEGIEQTEEDDSVQSLDYGAVVGAGAGFVLSGQQMLIDVRASLGQANVRQADPALHNIGVALFLSVTF